MRTATLTPYALAAGLLALAATAPAQAQTKVKTAQDLAGMQHLLGDPKTHMGMPSTALAC